MIQQAIRDTSMINNFMRVINKKQNKEPEDVLMQCALEGFECTYEKPLDISEINEFDVLKATSRFKKISIELLKSKTRKRVVVYARKLYILTCLKLFKKKPEVTLASIGNELGNRDHATVLHHRDRYRDLENLYKKFQKQSIKVQIDKLDSEVKSIIQILKENEH